MAATNPTVPGLNSNILSLPLLHQSVQQWSWRMDTERDLLTRWIHVRTLKFSGLRLETLARPEPPVTIRSLVMAIALVQVYDLDGEQYPVVIVLATGLLDKSLSADLDGPKVPDWDGLRYEIGEWAKANVVPKPGTATMDSIPDPADTL